MGVRNANRWKSFPMTLLMGLKKTNGKNARLRENNHFRLICTKNTLAFYTTTSDLRKCQLATESGNPVSEADLCPR